jgi:uncharacterized protein (TIGR03000 family)
MLSVLVASAGLTTGQSIYYGGLGSYGDYGTPGSFGGGYGYQYRGAYPSTYYPHTSTEVVRADDSARKEHEKQITAMMDKLKDLERKIEQGQQDRLSDMQRDMISRMNANEKMLTEVLRLIDPRLQQTQPAAGPEPVKTSDTKPNDNGSLAKLISDCIKDEMRAHKEELRTQSDQQLRKLEAIERRVEAVETKERMMRDEANATATNKALDKMVILLETIAPTNAQIAQGLKDIKSELVRIYLEHTEAPVSSKPISTGHSLARGLIIVSLPADAKLFLDNMPSNVGTNLRTFISPELEPGKSYYYNLRVEVERYNKIFTDTQKVFFQPGREVHVSFDHIDAAITNRLRKEKGE